MKIEILGITARKVLASLHPAIQYALLSLNVPLSI